MPCSSEGYPDLTREENDRLVRMMCEMLKHVDTTNLSAEAKAWKIDHDEKDRVRLQQERAKNCIHITFPEYFSCEDCVNWFKIFLSAKANDTYQVYSGINDWQLKLK